MRSVGIVATLISAPAAIVGVVGWFTPLLPDGVTFGALGIAAVALTISVVAYPPS